MYERGSEEFSRLTAFSDGIFAIAMTLLVIGVEVPRLDDPTNVGALADALGDESDSMVSFFVSFAVIGRYWAAHHAFIGLLARVDRRFLATNLVYLGFIAFLPFPTALLGDLFDNPLSVTIYAVAVAIVSGLEVLQFRVAYRDDLLRREMPAEVYRWGVLMSLSPVLFFLLSIPAAFLLGTGWAVAVWFLAIPYQLIVRPRRPQGADDFLLS